MQTKRILRQPINNSEKRYGVNTSNFNPNNIVSMNGQTVSPMLMNGSMPMNRSMNRSMNGSMPMQTNRSIRETANGSGIIGEGIIGNEGGQSVRFDQDVFQNLDTLTGPAANAFESGGFDTIFDLDQQLEAADVNIINPDGTTAGEGILIVDLPDQQVAPEPVCEPSEVAITFERNVDVIRGQVQDLDFRRDECGNDVGKTQRVTVRYVAGQWRAVNQDVINPSIHSGATANTQQAMESLGGVVSGFRAGRLRKA
jgi:hypothetical protein